MKVTVQGHDDDRATRDTAGMLRRAHIPYVQVEADPDVKVTPVVEASWSTPYAEHVQSWTGHQPDLLEALRRHK